jgi:hypothetical protein
MDREETPQGQLTEQLSRPEFVALEVDARFGPIESSGVQEETAYLGVRCFMLPDDTERPVTVRLATSVLLDLDSPHIDDTVLLRWQPKAVAERRLYGRDTPMCGWPSWPARLAQHRQQIADVWRECATPPRPRRRRERDTSAARAAASATRKPRRR